MLVTFFQASNLMQIHSKALGSMGRLDRYIYRSNKTKQIQPPGVFRKWLTHTIHVWYIYLHEWLFLMAKYGKCR